MNATIESNSRMTVTDAAKLIGVSPRTLHRWIRSGKGPNYLVTPTERIRILRTDVLKWFAGLTRVANNG